MMRAGKTFKDKHEIKCWGNRFGNMNERTLWMQHGGKFPAHTCNGKRNRNKAHQGKGR